MRRPAAAYGKVERRRGSLGSKPVFAGTRIPVETVTDWLAEGFTDKQIIEEYPDLAPADLRLARQLQASA